MIRTTFYFDTSAINQLADDPLRDLLVGALTAPGNVVLVSVLNVYELAATKDPARRLDLLRLAKRIAKDTRLLAFPQTNLRRSLDAFAAGQSTLDATFDYDSSQNIWIAFEHPEQVHEQARSEIRAQNLADEKWFREMHGGARNPMRAALPPHARPRTATRLLKLYFSRPDFIANALRPIVSVYHPELVGREYEIVQRVEPWKFFYAAFVASIFHHAIKDEGYGPGGNAGSTDTQQGAYVPTCDVFVTHDAPQLVSLRPLERLAHKRRRVRRYREVRLDLIAGRY